MINSKNILAFFITYLTVCSSLYHIVYWDRFYVNGLSLISVSNLIQSAIEPIVLAILFSTLLFVIAEIAIWFAIKSKRNKKSDIRIDQAKPKEVYKRSIFLVPMLFLCLCAFAFIMNKVPWQAQALYLSLFIYPFIRNTKLVAEDIRKYAMSKFLLMFVIYLPLISFLKAIDESDDIIANKKFNFTILENANSKSDTLKLLGITDNYNIFVTLDNKKVYYIKSDTLKIQRKK